MEFSFTPAAARKVLSILAERGGMALRIHIRKSGAAEKWAMTLEPASAATSVVDGVPVVVDGPTEKFLDGMVIDWVQTPEGPGFGVYERNLRDLNVLER